jgi:hypothetical protein
MTPFDVPATLVKASLDVDSHALGADLAYDCHRSMFDHRHNFPDSDLYACLRNLGHGNSRHSMKLRSDAKSLVNQVRLWSFLFRKRQAASHPYVIQLHRAERSLRFFLLLLIHHLQNHIVAPSPFEQCGHLNLEILPMLATRRCADPWKSLEILDRMGSSDSLEFWG